MQEDILKHTNEASLLVTSLNLSNKILIQTTDNNNNNKNHEQENFKDFYIGLLLALLSSFFIGSSFILKKKGLLKLSSTASPTHGGVLRAGQGGYGYLKEWLWWAGLITMGVGELCNFAAYGFAPATLVTPLGALSVLVSAIMSSYFLNENLNSIGKIGCFLTAIGSTVMVIHAPKEGEVHSVNELLIKLQNPEFIIFTIFSIAIILVLIFMFAPRYGNKNVLIYILICSILGSFTVMSCKGLSLGFKEMFSNSKTHQTASFFYTYMFAFIVILCIVMQMNYLNKSLDIFNTAIVTTIYYVLFTLCVMIASSILFKELTNLKFIDFVGCITGFATIVCALCLIHFFKNDNNNNNNSNNNLNDNNNLLLTNIKMANGTDDDDDENDDDDYNGKNNNTNKDDNSNYIEEKLNFLGNNKIIKRFLNTFNNDKFKNSNLNLLKNNNNNNYMLLTTNTVNDDVENNFKSTSNHQQLKKLNSQNSFHEVV